jgi:hypothetical protein
MPACTESASNQAPRTACAATRLALGWPHATAPAGSPSSAGGGAWRCREAHPLQASCRSVVASVHPSSAHLNTFYSVSVRNALSCRFSPPDHLSLPLTSFSPGAPPHRARLLPGDVHGICGARGLLDRLHSNGQAGRRIRGCQRHRAVGLLLGVCGVAGAPRTLALGLPLGQPGLLPGGVRCLAGCT